MSYADTDVDDQDVIRKEMVVLEKLVKVLLDMAWYFAEKAQRETGRGSCGHVEIIVKPFCTCCDRFRQLRNKAEGLRSRL